VVTEIDFRDNYGILNLIDHKQTGILSMLDDSVRVNVSDQASCWRICWGGEGGVVVSVGVRSFVYVGMRRGGEGGAPVVQPSSSPVCGLTHTHTPLPCTPTSRTTTTFSTPSWSGSTLARRSTSPARTCQAHCGTPTATAPLASATTRALWRTLGLRAAHPAGSLCTAVLLLTPAWSSVTICL
jgi:hypothetical protein